MRLSWKIYIFGYAFFSLLQAAYSLLPNSAAYIYYKILISFDKIFLWQYVWHYISVFAEVFALVPLFLFAIKKGWLRPLFWQIFFFVRILSFLAGSSYLINLMGTLLNANILLAVVNILIAFLIILPSYVALFSYAFKRG